MNLKRLINRYGIEYLLEELIGVIHCELKEESDSYLNELFHNLSIALSRYKDRYNED